MERRWAAIAFALAVIVLLGVFGAAWRSGERLAADSDWRQHTYEVIGEVRGLLNALIDAETGERGYLLTGDAGFLAPFRGGAAAVGPRLASLRQLTADNPRQQRRLDALEPLARAELAQLDDAVDVRGRAGASGVSLAASIESRRLMDRLRARVRAGAQRMAQLIDDLLRLARISRLPMTAQEVDLSALAETIAGELRGRDPDRPARWEIEPGVHARGDEPLLRIVLENLLGNAWKFTRRQPEPRIAFGSENGGPESVYFVRDNGAGFDMTFADKLFGPFQRLHSERDFEGTGIGLATVARVVHIHGGRVWAESELGRGAIFRFTLGGGVGRPAAARARDTP